MIINVVCGMHLIIQKCQINMRKSYFHFQNGALGGRNQVVRLSNQGHIKFWIEKDLFSEKNGLPRLALSVMGLTRQDYK